MQQFYGVFHLPNNVLYVWHAAMWVLPLHIICMLKGPLPLPFVAEHSQLFIFFGMATINIHNFEFKDFFYYRIPISLLY